GPHIAGTGRTRTDRTRTYAAPPRRASGSDRKRGHRGAPHVARGRPGGCTAVVRLRSQRSGPAHVCRCPGRTESAARRPELPPLDAHEGGGVHGARVARGRHRGPGGSVLVHRTPSGTCRDRGGFPGPPGRRRGGSHPARRPGSTPVLRVHRSYDRSVLVPLAGTGEVVRQTTGELVGRGQRLSGAHSRTTTSPRAEVAHFG